MANVMRPLIQWPRLHRHCYYRPAAAALYHSQASSKWPRINGRYHLILIDSPISLSSSYTTQVRCFRSHALKPRNIPLPLDSADSDSDSSSSDATSSKKRSRNEKKREAKRAVKWAMELSDFSPLQIKRILRAASLDESDDVYEAILLVKRFGRDVKEGKRRQYNYIARLLREADADAELMDGLIQATKDNDEIKFRNLSGPQVQSIEDSKNKQVEETDDESESEVEVELTQDQTDLVTRWMDGLISRDVQITNEIYSMQHVDFDRQELRRLVRKVHSVQENQVTLEEEKGEQVVVAETVTGAATRSLNRFLRDIVKHLSME